jgi:hypothetical protein
MVLWWYKMDQWIVKWTYQCTPDDGRVTAETYVGWIEQKYENKKVHSLVKKLKINVKDARWTQRKIPAYI